MENGCDFLDVWMCSQKQRIWRIRGEGKVELEERGKFYELRWQRKATHVSSCHSGSWPKLPSTESLCGGVLQTPAADALNPTGTVIRRADQPWPLDQESSEKAESRERTAGDIIINMSIGLNLSYY